MFRHLQCITLLPYVKRWLFLLLNEGYFFKVVLYEALKISLFCHFHENGTDKLLGFGKNSKRAI